jgi:DNA/RNA endonuclease G (NUC1)
MILTSGLALAALSCKNGGETADVALRLTLSSPEAVYTAGNVWASVEAAGAWTLDLRYIVEDDSGPMDEGEGWIRSLTPGSGSGNNSAIAVNYSANLSEEAREVELILTGGGQTASARLRQRGNSSTTTPPPPDGGVVNPTPSPNVLLWPELPQVDTGAGTNLAFIVHFGELGTGRARNYSMLYDADVKISYWVAYPLCGTYKQKVTSRTDKWAYDPYIAGPKQANIKKAYSGGSYDRGHQIPSGDRVCSVEMNQQTFYYTNMTPQNSTFNQQAWGNLEGWVRDMAPNNNSDTLYVVTGAILRKVGGNETIRYAKDNNGADCPVPNYYYKALLLREGGAYKKAIGFWYDNQPLTGKQPTRAYAKSVREIEALTGFNFFANLSQADQDRVEATDYNPSQWGL